MRAWIWLRRALAPLCEVAAAALPALTGTAAGAAAAGGATAGSGGAAGGAAASAGGAGVAPHVEDTMRTRVTLASGSLSLVIVCVAVSIPPAVNAVATGCCNVGDQHAGSRHKRVN
jgi:hypothetical protein